MKTSIYFILMIALTACTTRPKETIAERDARIERERIFDEQVKAEAARIAATEKVGAKQADFDANHGEPSEVHTDKDTTVYAFANWNPPMIFVFKKGVLVSKFIDKQMLAQKESAELQRAQILQQQEANREQSKFNRLMLWQSMQNSRPQPTYQQQPYQMPTRKTTNCTSQRFGNMVNTTCN
jgi:hypothetical protein